MKRLTVLSLVLMILVAGSAMAAPKTSADVVTAVASLKTLESEQGQRVDFAVKLDIAKRWHLYAHGDSNFIGVDLVPAEDFPLAEFTASYPKGHPKEFFGEMVQMIEGAETIKASALVPADLAAGKYELALKVTVQACDDKTCLRPDYLPIKIELTVP